MPRRRKPTAQSPSCVQSSPSLPTLLTVQDLASWLRTTRKAIHIMTQRGKLPAPINIGQRRLLWRERDVADWLDRMESRSGVRS